MVEKCFVRRTRVHSVNPKCRVWEYSWKKQSISNIKVIHVWEICFFLFFLGDFARLDQHYQKRCHCLHFITPAVGDDLIKLYSAMRLSDQKMWYLCVDQL